MVKTAAGMLAVLVGAPALVAAQSSTQVSPQRLREPLPLEVAVSVQAHNGRSPINFSPDGEWIAHTTQTDETVPYDVRTSVYSPTGFPFAEGNSRMAATLTNTRTGENVRLGAPESLSWAAVWSPDGKHVAFYSDAGGEAGLWIWDRATRKSARVPGVIARPFFGFDGVRWSADGQRLLVKVLPAGMTVDQANANWGAGMPNSGKSAIESAGPGLPAVRVRRHDPALDKPQAAVPDAVTRRPPVGRMTWAAVDLAIVDVRDLSVTRLVKNATVEAYAFSPDQKLVAYTESRGAEPDTQQTDHDLAVCEVATGRIRVVAPNIRINYGIEWSWSPDSRTLAYIESGQLASGAMVLIPVAAGGQERRLEGAGLPSFNYRQEGENAPLWSPDSAQLFAVGAGQLWKVDAKTGRGIAVGKAPGWDFRALISPFGHPVLWSSDKGRTVWAIARRSDGNGSGIFAVDLASGSTRQALNEPKTYAGIYNVAASGNTGDLAFVSTSQQSLQEIWFFNIRDGRARQGTSLNPDLERYALGEARIIEWQGPDGKALRGTLLLPPGYRAGTRLPLVVDVYGGAMGSNYINSFGGPLGISPMLNMHVLATRGYAVLFPDAPLREGHTMDDIVKVVMPGVDAAIAQGYADAERLAAIGQSYGSYNVLSLIVQTDRFKAASVTAAVVHPDLFAAYLGWAGYFEHGQGNMGGTIWDQRQRYFDNSPLFVFDRIRTPLLIGQGDRDMDLVPSSAIYSALERLDKPVELRVYGGESHVISQKANVLDFWRRRLDFFAEHLDLATDAHGGVIFDDGHARSRSAAH